MSRSEAGFIACAANAASGRATPAQVSPSRFSRRSTSLVARFARLRASSASRSACRASRAELPGNRLRVRECRLQCGPVGRSSLALVRGRALRLRLDLDPRERLEARRLDLLRQRAGNEVVHRLWPGRSTLQCRAHLVERRVGGVAPRLGEELLGALLKRVERLALGLSCRVELRRRGAVRTAEPLRALDELLHVLAPRARELVDRPDGDGRLAQLGNGLGVLGFAGLLQRLGERVAFGDEVLERDAVELLGSLLGAPWFSAGHAVQLSRCGRA